MAKKNEVTLNSLFELSANHRKSMEVVVVGEYFSDCPKKFDYEKLVEHLRYGVLPEEFHTWELYDEHSPEELATLLDKAMEQALYSREMEQRRLKSQIKKNFMVIPKKYAVRLRELVSTVTDDVDYDDNGEPGQWLEGLFYPGVPEHVADARKLLKKLR